MWANDSSFCFALIDWWNTWNVYIHVFDSQSHVTEWNQPTITVFSWFGSQIRIRCVCIHGGRLGLQRLVTAEGEQKRWISQVVSSVSSLWRTNCWGQLTHEKHVSTHWSSLSAVFLAKRTVAQCDDTFALKKQWDELILLTNESQPFSASKQISRNSYAVFFFTLCFVPLLSAEI